MHAVRQWEVRIERGVLMLDLCCWILLYKRRDHTLPYWNIQLCDWAVQRVVMHKL